MNKTWKIEDYSKNNTIQYKSIPTAPVYPKLANGSNTTEVLTF